LRPRVAQVPRCNENTGEIFQRDLDELEAWMQTFDIPLDKNVAKRAMLDSLEAVGQGPRCWGGGSIAALRQRVRVSEPLG
jgi:hypothetical protein